MQYIPVLDTPPEQLLNDILKKAKYFKEEHKKAVFKAFYYALKFHGDQKRLSGEPYIIHPIKVVEFLMRTKPGVTTIQAALLHDLIEDTEITFTDIQNEFGEDVATLCNGLVKVSKVRYKGEDRHLETLKKTFLAMGKDLRVIIIKIADRLHNIQTLHYHPSQQKRARIAEETLKIYVPIAKRLGLYIYQGYLENGAFFQLRPKEYQRIYDYVTKQYGDVDQFRNAGIQRLELLCQQEEITYQTVLGRLKSPYRIYTKLKKYQTHDISKIMDILAFRIITTDVSSCYNILGIIHKHYTPIFSKMKDYIAIPKSNGYKSLHTTVLGMFEFPVEIQVRTVEMDHIANYGIAAHFAYSDESDSVEVSKEQAQRIERIQDIVTKYHEATDKESFRHELDIELLQKNIFIYTPKGDIIEMPQNSTLLDFAFRVHTDIGLKFKNGFINGKIVPIDYLLKTGDIVKIETFKNKYNATRSWLTAVNTPTAKAKIHRYLRNREKTEILKSLEHQINEKLEELHLPHLHSKDDRITKTFKDDTYEQLLLKIRDKQLSPSRLIKNMYDDVMAKTEHTILQKKQETAQMLFKSNERAIIVDGDKLLDVKLCPECKPVFPQRIISKSSKEGIKIHALGCKAFSTIDYAKLLEAHRQTQEIKPYILILKLESVNKPGTLLQILRVLDYYGINAKYINATDTEVSGISIIDLHLEFNTPSKIAFLLKDLKQKKNLIKVIQTTLT